ncbi:MAG TPA: AMP-binding protein [Syntrophomonadaceae bacterium]|nr:AMP-binding protein [Syntrophomonadaceae bacterium]
MSNPYIMWENFEKQVFTIPQALYNNQKVFGTRPAQLFKENGRWRMISYNDLVTGCENIALALIKLGMAKHDLLAIKAHSSARWAWADLGNMFAGGATVSIYPTLSKDETIMIANHCEFRLLYVDTVEQLYEVLSYKDEMPSLEYLVCFEKGFRGDGKTVFGLGELIGMGAAERQENMELLRDRLAEIDGDSPAAMVYTSGTTGRLKGAMHSHQSILYAAIRGYTHLIKYNRIENQDCVSMITLPLSHIMEKVNGYYGPTIIGGLVGFCESPATALMDINFIRPTWITWVPRLAARMYQGFENAFAATPEGKKLWDWAIDVAIKTTYALEDEEGYIDMTIPFEEQLEGELREQWLTAYNMVYWRVHHALGGRMRDLNIGGAYMDPELQRRLVGMGVYIGLGYGLTETAAGVAESAPSAYKIGWISPPNPGVEFKLADDGELLMRGNGIITEYYKDEEATRESFTSDGWFKSGDIAEMDSRGYIRIVDRKKSIIVLDTGKNVAQARIESVCNNSPLLEQVVVIGENRKYISALVVPNYAAILQMMQSRSIPFDESKVEYGEVNGMYMCTAVGEDVIEHPEVIAVIQNEINKVNEQLDDFETIKKFKLLPRRLSEEAGELTPSSKIKMRVVLDHFADEIESLY